MRPLQSRRIRWRFFTRGADNLMKIFQQQPTDEGRQLLDRMEEISRLQKWLKKKLFALPKDNQEQLRGTLHTSPRQRKECEDNVF